MAEQQEPASPETSQGGPTVQPPPAPSGGGPNLGLIIGVIVLVIVVIGGVIYLVYSTTKKKEVTPRPEAKVEEEAAPVTKPAITPETPTEVPGAALKTYTNSFPKYTLQYPSDWQIDSSKASGSPGYDLLMLNLTKKGHTLEISMPGGYGPSVCAFKGAPLPTEGPGSGQTPAEYVEIANPNYPTRPFRRAIQPTMGSEKNPQSIWYICQKEAGSDYFVSATVVDLIRYLGPIEFDDVVVQEMDEIVRTIKAELKK